MHRRASGLEKLTRQEMAYEVRAVLFIASLMAQWVKNLPAMQETGNADSIPGSGRSSRGGNGNPLQYSCLGNPMDRGARQAIVHGVAKNQTQLSTHTYIHRYMLIN